MRRRSLSTEAEVAAPPRVIALAGNPNSGKTSLFNEMTGLRRKVGNYPGVTVERVEGALTQADGSVARLVDLPGCYSLTPRSEDERVARNVLLGLDRSIPRPAAVISVVDASNLERNLFLTTQLIDTGTPVIVALNMVDVAERRHTPVDAEALQDALGVPVVPIVARTGQNVAQLIAHLDTAASPERRWHLPAEAQDVVGTLARAVREADHVPERAAEAEALRLLSLDEEAIQHMRYGGAELREALTSARRALEAAGIDREALEAECRFRYCQEIAGRVRTERAAGIPTRSERADRILTHRILGPIIFLLVMGTIFQAVYSWGEPFMGWIEELTGWAQGLVAGVLGEGVLTDLLVDGVIAGVGNVIIFLPQICLLFLFLTVLEDLGYLARAAFLVDRVMRTAGLSGKSFVPFMSSFACAIPGIMAARSIDSQRDRMVTILVAPLMSCSARLPVYALLIAAFIPLAYQGITLLSMYAVSVGMALLVAWLFRKTMFKGESSTFLLELPPYHLPSIKAVLRTVGYRGFVFVKQAGTFILAASIVLWFLAYFPRNEEIATEATARIEAGQEEEEVRNWESGEQLRQSYAGRMGHAIEPVIEPLGYDWKTGVGIIASFAAREVMVSTLGIVYSVGEADEESVALRDKLRNDKRPDGTPVFSILSALSLMVFFVLACQCMSTLAVVKRETNSWRWPIFMFAYMTVLAYVGALLVYQGGLALGFGP